VFDGEVKARQVTSELSDKPVTNDQGLTAATGDRPLACCY